MNNSAGSRTEPSKYGTSTGRASDVGNKTRESQSVSAGGPGASSSSNSYSSLGRSSNYGNLYKLPNTSAGNTTATSSSNYGNNWAERNSGRNHNDISSSRETGAVGKTGAVRNGASASSTGSESNLLSPYSAAGYSRSVSREKEAEATKADSPVKSETSSSTLPRSFRAYNQRSTTNTTFQSPSTYTPRVPAYGRTNHTTSRDLSFSSALPAPKTATQPATATTTERSYRSLLNSEPVTSKALPVVTVEEIKKEIPKIEEDANKSESEESEESESESSDEEEAVGQVTEANYVISRGTSPSPATESSVQPRTNIPSMVPISGSIRSPKVLRSRLPTVTAREVQTEDPESIRPRRFIGYTGSPTSYGSAGSSRPGSYADRYFSKYVAPSRYSSGTSPPVEEKAKSIKEPSPPTSTLHKPPIPAGVGNKEYRKSALNVDLDDQQISEFRKRQEEFREAQRRAKRQARKNSSGGSASSSVSPGPMDRRSTSRRGSVSSEKGGTPLSRSSSTKIQQQEKSVSRSQSRRKISSSVKNSSSSRSSSCSSSSSEEEKRPPPETAGRMKSQSPSGGLPVRSIRKSSTSSESVGRMKLSRNSTDRSIASASPPRKSQSHQPSCSPTKSRSPSVPKSPLAQSDSIQQIVQKQSDSSRSVSRSPSVNWSKLLKMTRGPDERSSTSPESLPSNSSGGNKVAASRSPSYNKMLIRSPDARTSPVARSSSAASRTHRVSSSSSSLPPGLPNRSGRNTASSSRSHIPSRNASARSIARSCSTSTDSSTSTESDRVQHSRSVSRIKESANSSKRNSLEPSSGAAESSFAAKLASSFGWLRKQNSEIMPWWMPSTDNIPAKEQEEEEEEKEAPVKADESSTSSADETQSSSSTEEETESTENKRDDTDVEVDDLPADLGLILKSPEESPVIIPELSSFPVKKSDSHSDPGEELGDRSSPDGFEWPDCPATPPMTRSYPFYRRAPSPYDNVMPDIPAVTSTIQPSPSGCSMNTAWGLDALRALESLETISVQQLKQTPLSDYEETEEKQMKVEETDDEDEDEDKSKEKVEEIKEETKEESDDNSEEEEEEEEDGIFYIVRHKE